ncbi:MAG: DUF1700 domain-containing protein [Oscillospiraceae bacterium]|jgi:uncharacterized membrane protein|nr:DUF1700 domain-containing protein [Oscillospiraceae bacterium]
MTREAFMNQLREQLHGFSPAEVSRVLEYYDELFSDSLEAGKTEEEICAGLDAPQAIAERVRVELAFARAEQAPSAKTVNTVLIILLSVFALPVGIPLAFALLMVLFAAAMVVFAIAIVCFTLVLAFGACGVVFVVFSVYTVFTGLPLHGFALLGAGLILSGLSLVFGVLGWKVMRSLLKGCVKLMRWMYSAVTRKNKKEART